MPTSPGEDIQSWSTVAANNGTADTLINWAEGQARASVNNSARSMMAAHAKVRNLLNGSIVTTGSGNAQQFLSGLSYTTIPTNLVVRLKIGHGFTNTGPTTLNMDGLGDTEIRTTNGDKMRGGELCADGYVDLLYNGTYWIFLYSQQFIDNRFTEGGGLIIGKQIFDVAGTFTYTPTPGMECCIGEAIGGGGGGGGNFNTAANQATGGGGGGSGGYSRRVLTAADIGASQTVTIGAGGSGGNNNGYGGGGDGGNGGDTSLGSLLVAKGGGGGKCGDIRFQAGYPGAGGTTTGAVGDITAAGSPGEAAMFANFTGSNGLYVSAGGGSSAFGGGAPAVGTSGNGAAASNYGSGGAGGLGQGGITANMAGGNGSAGVIVITEFAGRGSPGRDGAAGATGPIGPAGPTGPGTGDVLRSGTPTGGQVAIWTDASHIAGFNPGTISFGPPQGRLSLSGLVPVVTSSIAATTGIAYSGYVGDKVPIWDGTNWTMTTLPGGYLGQIITDTSKNPAAIGANKVNDWFIWNDAGTVRLSHGPDWTNDTTRSAGTALVRVNGIWLNNVSITNACAASRGTYVGTTRSNGTSTLDWIFGATAAGGTAAFFGVWNAYNRVDVATLVADNTDSWSYSSAAFRAANASNAMRVSFVRGLDEDGITANYCGLTSNGSATAGHVGVGLDSTSAASGIVTGGGQGILATVFGSYVGIPGLGFHFVQALEKCQTATLVSFYGDAGVGIQSGLTATLKA